MYTDVKKSDRCCKNKKMYEKCRGLASLYLKQSCV